MIMKAVRIALAVIIVSGIMAQAVAQDTGRTKMLSFVPQYIFRHGIRVDYEHSLPKPGHWLHLGPQLYASTNGDYGYEYHDFEELYGVGLDVGFKYFPGENVSGPRGVYISYGPTLHFFNIQREEEVFGQILPDGGTSFETKALNHNVLKFGANTVIGLQVAANDYLYFDFYTGVGIRYAITTGDNADDYDYNNSITDWGFTGPLILGGIRVGVRMK